MTGNNYSITSGLNGTVYFHHGDNNICILGLTIYIHTHTHDIS